MNEFERAKMLFNQGVKEFEAKDYSEALRFFNASIKLNHENSTEIYIRKCKKFIESQKENTNQGPQNSNNNDTKPNNNTESNNNNNFTNKNNNNTTNNPGLTDQDKECLKITKQKDYYEILNVGKSADEAEIKKSYKKLAIKFHPDKNQSKYAEEAFKKISQAFQCLKDPEKRQKYDTFGSEEEIREQQFQFQNARDMNDIDPFDLFDIILNGGNIHNMNRRRGNRNPHNQGENYHRRNHHNHVEINISPLAKLIQFFPIIVILIFWVFPLFFQSKPYYQFDRDEVYYKTMYSEYNHLKYFVGDRFIDYYTTKEDISKIELYVERDYLNHAMQKCNASIRKKNELEYTMYYYQGSHHFNSLKKQYDSIDMTKCNEYHRLKNLIR